MNQNSKKLHYGYIIAVVLFLQGFLIGGTIFGASGQFLVPVTESLGISQTQFSMYNTVQQISMGVAIIIAPKLIAKFGFKKMNTLMLIPVALGFTVMAFAQNEFYLYVGGALIGFAICFITYLGAGTLLPRWFKSRLSTVLAFAVSGMAIGGMVLNPVISAMLQGDALLGFAESWRSTYLLVGLAMFAVCFPTTALLVKDFPEQKGLAPYSEGEEAETVVGGIVEGVSKGDAIKSSSFVWWIINIISWTLATTIIAFFPAYASSTEAATTASFDLVGLINSVEGIGALLGGYIIGFLFDKLGVKAGTIYSSIAGIAGILIMLISKNSAVVMMVGAFIFGNYYQIANVSMPVMVNTMYGAKDYDTIFPMGAAIAPWVGAVAYPLWGTINDMTGSYTGTFGVVIAMCVITGLSCVLAVQSAKKLPRSTAERK